MRQEHLRSNPDANGNHNRQAADVADSSEAYARLGPTAIVREIQAPSLDQPARGALLLVATSIGSPGHLGSVPPHHPLQPAVHAQTLDLATCIHQYAVYVLALDSAAHTTGRLSTCSRWTRPHMHSSVCSLRARAGLCCPHHQPAVYVLALDPASCTHQYAVYVLALDSAAPSQGGFTTLSTTNRASYVLALGFTARAAYVLALGARPRHLYTG